MHTITSAWEEDQDKQDSHNKGSGIFDFLFFFKCTFITVIYSSKIKHITFFYQIKVFCISDAGLSESFSFP